MNTLKTLCISGLLAVVMVIPLFTFQMKPDARLRQDAAERECRAEPHTMAQFRECFDGWRDRQPAQGGSTHD